MEKRAGNIISNSSGLIKEMNDRTLFASKGRPVYSAAMIRYALLLRHISLQTYKMLLKELPMPSIRFLRKIQEGGVDTLKAIKYLKDTGEISSDVCLLIDEMLIQKCTNYQSGEFIGQDDN